MTAVAPEPSQAPGQVSRRFEALDAVRGAALLWMAAFHFCFDLSNFGFWRQDFYRDPFWTVQRTLILSLFLLCAGAAQAIAQAQGQSGARFRRRWLQVAGCALLVSAGSWFMFPKSFIYFGVLHGMAVMLVLLRFVTLRFPRSRPWFLPLGALALVLPLAAQWVAPEGPAAHWLDSKALNWLGFVTAKPITEDYVPLLPWIGVMLWGYALGDLVLSRQPTRVAAPLPTGLRPLAALGRWSLSFYMLHQPVLIGLLMLAGARL